jgi:hypothetical protein
MDWNVMDRLHQKGYISSNPAKRNQSVELSEEGLAEAELTGEKTVFSCAVGRNELLASVLFCPEAAAFVARSRR